ncbi:MAG: helix-turn-helix domain-containing protein [Solobacterium sp.]|jgi:hypothetical protein|nr:helix-turn-helix domain-containing protein [Solobacterium sp.]MCH4049333.1 helix-turn-helix domain-containing protein [Solobacterium sp.]MCH4075189.1 helix-turn-helix domain-containing protein [Solobacterium sp.]MCI1313334.1 helix-turn-helix domain-containing protein [Solobacterium sp.]MCI1345585.1 helix-turn-helix domain-containing protein [Solobacterium sp.]
MTVKNKENIYEATRFYSQQEVADMLHVSTHYVTRLRRIGLLNGRRFGRGWLYTHDDIWDFLQISAGHDLYEIANMTDDAARRAVEDWRH